MTKEALNIKIIESLPTSIKYRLLERQYKQFSNVDYIKISGNVVYSYSFFYIIKILKQLHLAFYFPLPSILKELPPKIANYSLGDVSLTYEFNNSANESILLGEAYYYEESSFVL